MKHILGILYSRACQLFALPLHRWITTPLECVLPMIQMIHFTTKQTINNNKKDCTSFNIYYNVMMSCELSVNFICGISLLCNQKVMYCNLFVLDYRYANVFLLILSIIISVVLIM